MDEKDRFMLKWALSFLALGLSVPIVVMLLIDHDIAIVIQMLVILVMMTILAIKALRKNHSGKTE